MTLTDSFEALTDADWAKLDFYGWRDPKFARRALAAEPDRPHGARAVADYIAGMTDRFATREHERLTGQRLLG